MPQLVIMLLEAFTFSNKSKLNFLQTISCDSATASDCVERRIYFW